jgi:uncharacterized protein YgiM (DUF1202 family)
MKKVAIILVLSMVLSVLGLTKEVVINVKAAEPIISPIELYDKASIVSNYSTSSKGNIEITAKNLNVRQDKSTDSVIVSEVYLGDIYEVLDSGKDDQGKVWYKINAELGVTGWVAGLYCKKTKENINTANESEPGKLYYECTKEALFIKLLLLDDYSLSKVLKVCGSNYTKKKDFYYDLYEYQDGTKVEVNTSKEVLSIEVGQRSIYVSEIKKLKADLFQNIGNEVIIFTGYSFIVIEAKSKKIIREFRSGYMDLDEIKVGNFVGDGKAELYLSGFNNNSSIRNIYEVINNTFVRSYNIGSFLEYGDGINAKIEQSNLKLDINIGNYSTSESSVLPERVFYNTKDIKDKNDLLSIDPYWTVVQKDGNWYINVRYKVNLVIINFYWGPPLEDMEDNEKMYNDLAYVDILLDVRDKAPEIKEVTHAIKYNDPSMNQVKPILVEEGVIVNGPELGTSMKEAYKSLGGKLPKDYSDIQKLNGVSLFEFCAQVVDIFVESPKYETTRGLKVGDDITKVESLYGKPDSGFSGDSMVEYKFCYEDYEGNLQLNYYRTLTIFYKNGLVSAYELTQVILD